MSCDCTARGQILGRVSPEAGRDCSDGPVVEPGGPLGVIAGEEGRDVILVTWDLELGAGEWTMEL